jgi:hypothetical protein
MVSQVLGILTCCKKAKLRVHQAMDDRSTFVAPVLQIMPGLQELCAELVLPQSDEPAKVDPLAVSIPALAPSQTLGFEECGVVGVRHVVPVGDAMSKKGVVGG